MMIDMSAIRSDITGRTICFGHQSVGFNIIAGICDLMAKDDSLDLPIRETSDLENQPGPVLAHFRNGVNRDWQSKIDAFQAAIRKGLGRVPDMALFKFCYVDITADTDVREVWAAYQRTMQQLEGEFPATIFLHVTVPLQTAGAGWKQWLQKFWGQTKVGVPADNIRRNELNALFREQYGRSGRLFDLARVEATRPDGRRELFVARGTRYEALAREFTDDGGHLNEPGRMAVAANFLKTLANAGG